MVQVLISKDIHLDSKTDQSKWKKDYVREIAEHYLRGEKTKRLFF